MKSLWLICHTPSANTQAMADALMRGAKGASTGIEIHLTQPLTCTAEDLTHADAIVILTTENLGYMAGATKDWFDRIFYPLENSKHGLPYFLIIRAGLDGTGTETAITNICGGLKWNLVQPTTLCQGSWQPEFETQCYELGMLAATSLDIGII